MAHILVIDDETMIRSLLQEILENAGHKVTEAPNGKIGIEQFQERPADLVITDIIMPQQEGLNTIFELKKIAPDLKIIAISGEQEAENFLETAKQFGASQIFNKPIKGKILLQAIEEALADTGNNPYQEQQILLLNEQPEKFAIPTNIFSPIESLVLQVQTQEEALNVARKHDFSLVLFVATEEKARDLQWVQTLLKLEKECPPFVLFLLEKAPPAHVAQIYEAGAVDVLFPPFQGETFLAKVHIFIELYQQKVFLVGQTRQLETTLQTQYTISDNLITTAKELKQSKKQLEKVYSELEQMTGVFQLFVPKPFLKRLTQNSFQAGHFEPEKLTILFGDIRGYTQYSEQISPSENFDFLNEFFGLMEPFIAQNGGFIDQFLGDGVMALFDQEKSADHALQAAIQMQEALEAFSQERKAQGLPGIQMGIGINTGEVMVGALGSANRLNSTVIGDPVNLSSRLEELTKKFEAKILISEYTHALLEKDHYQMREVDTVKIRGRSQPVIVYEVFNNDAPDLLEAKLNANETFTQGIALYKAQKFGQALKVFEACLDLHKDLLFFEYVKRCDYFQMHPPQDHEWDGSVPEKELLIGHTRRRRMTRHTTHSQANVLLDNAQLQQVDGVALDVSSNGMRLQVTQKPANGKKRGMAQKFRVGAIFFVEVFLPNNEQTKNPTKFKLLSQVKWVSASAQDSLTSWQIGLETLELPSHSDISLQDMLSQYHQG